MSPSGAESGNRTAILNGQLFVWNLTSKGTVFSAEAGFQLPDGSILSPDAAWMSSERRNLLRDADFRRYPKAIPELVIKVRSPSDSLAQLREKCGRWITGGAQIVLLIDADDKRTEIFAAGREPLESLEEKLAVPGFEGLVFELADVWRGLGE
jgi:Uma2 family endonuclease